MFKNNSKLIYLLLAITLVGCSTTNKQTFNTSKTSYDPFSIKNNQSLVLPPVYYLTAEEIHSERKNMQNQSDRVKAILFGETTRYIASSKVNNLDAADLKFLKLTKSDSDKSSVRKKLDFEYNNLVAKDQKFIKKVSSKDEELHDKLSEYIKVNNK